MSPSIILSVFIIYTCIIFIITYVTSRKADQLSFFLGNKTSPWYVVAYGMIGASLSGITFMSIPGWVSDTQFSYMVVVFGYLVGYFAIAKILLPLYYRLNLTSIYTYLEQRFGFWTYKTGAVFFLLSRTMGASLRMFVVVNVLQVFVFDAWGIPFWVNVSMFIILIILYTVKGGIKTIIWTDTLQTTCMILAVILSIGFISKEIHMDLGTLLSTIRHSHASQVFIMDWHSKRYFIKQFLSGIFIAIVMTGLDQEMMQKNLSCRNLKDAQTNMFSFSGSLLFANLMFLILGATLLIYADRLGIHVASTDNLFPTIALKFLSPLAGLVFLIGLISAAYPSADGALTSLTTSFCIDILNFNKTENLSVHQKKRIRYAVHIGIALILWVIIILFRTINDKAIIDKLFTIAGYTYGPILGFFSFGLFTKWQVKDLWIPLIALFSPVICYIISVHSQTWLHGYIFGFELLIFNGMLTFAGMMIVRKAN